MGNIGHFFKTAVIYFLGNVFTKLIAFFLLPLYTIKLPPEDFGMYDLVFSLTNLIIPLIFFQIWDSVFRFSFDYEDKEEKYQVINNGLIIMIIGSAIYTISYIFFSIKIKFEYPILIYLYSISMGIQYFYNSIARGFQENTLFVISGCINSILNITLNIVLICILDMGIESLYISIILATFVQIIIMHIKLNPFSKLIKYKFNKNQIRIMLNFALPLSINTISYWLLNGLTKVVISSQVGIYENGLYAVANRFSSMIVLLVSIFQFAWNEMAYTLANKEDKNLYYLSTIRTILKVSMLGSCIFLIIIKIIFPHFISHEYQKAIYIIPITFIGGTINSFSSFVGTIFLADKKSIQLFTSTLIAAVSNILGLCILTPLWGLMGAVTSLCFAFLIGAINRLILLKKYNKISLKVKDYWPVIIIIGTFIIFYICENIFSLIIVLIGLIIITLISLKAYIKDIIKIIKLRVSKN